MVQNISDNSIKIENVEVQRKTPIHKSQVKLNPTEKESTICNFACQKNTLSQKIMLFCGYLCTKDQAKTRFESDQQIETLNVIQNPISLRGGGCGKPSSVILPQATRQANKLIMKLPNNFTNNLEFYLKRITGKAHLANDEGQQEEIFIAIQWFMAMKVHLNNLCSNGSSVYDLISNQLPELIKSTITFTKISGFLCLQVLYIINDLTRIIFSYFMTSENRFFKIDYKQNILDLLNDLKTQVEIEAANLWVAGIEFEIEMIRAVIESAPSDSNEGQELLFSFMGGLAESILAMSPTEQLITAIIDGAVFLHNKYQAENLKKKYEIYYFFESLKWQVLCSLESGEVQVNSILQLISTAYKKHIEISDDWILNFCWIKFICFVMQYRPYLNKRNSGLESWTEMMARKMIRQVSFDRNQARVVLPSDVQDYNKVPEPLRQVGIIQFNALQNFILNTVSYSQKKALIMEINHQGQESRKDYLREFIHQYSDSQEIEQKLLNLEQTFKQLYIECRKLQTHKVQHLKDFDQQTQNLQNKVQEIIETLKISLNCVEVIQCKLFYIFKKLRLISMTLIIDRNQQKGELLKLNEAISIKAIEFENQFKEECCRYYEKILSKKMVCLESILILQDLLIKNENDQSKRISDNIKQIDDFIGKILEYQNHVKKLLKQLASFKQNYSKLLLTNQQLNYEGINNLEQIKEQLLNVVWFSEIVNATKSLISIYKEIQQTDDLSLNQCYIKLFIVEYSSSNLNSKLQQQQSKLGAIQIHLKRAQTNKLQEQQIPIEKLYRKDEIYEFVQSTLQIFSNYSQQLESQEKLVNQSEQKSFIENLQRCVQTQKITLSEISARLQDTKVVQLLILQLTLFEKQINYYLESQVNIDQLTGLIQQFLVKLSAFQQKLQNQVCFKEAESVQGQQIDVKNQQPNFQTNSEMDKEFSKKPQDFSGVKIDFDSILIPQIKVIEEAILRCQRICKIATENLGLLQEAKQVDESFSQISNNHEDIVSEIKKLVFNQIRNLQSDIEYLENCNFQFQSNSEQTTQIYVNQQDFFQQLFLILDELQQIQDIRVVGKEDEGILNIFEDQNYKVRECLVVNIFMLEAAQLEPRIVQFCQQTLLQVWTYEKDERVRMLLKNDEFRQLQKKIFSKNLKSFVNKLQDEMKQRLENMNNLEQKIQLEGNFEQREKLQVQLTEEHAQFEEFLDNVNDMTAKLDISIQFLKEIKKDLSLIKQKIDKLQESINEISDDIRKLKGKTCIELLGIRKRKVLGLKQFRDLNSLYIPLNVIEWDPILGKVKQEKNANSGKDEDKVTNLLADDVNDVNNGEVNEFIMQRDKDVMLIRGLAGSGKSRAASKIEEFLWEKQSVWVPIYVSLPSIKEPKFNLIDQALMSEYYQFDKMQIRELKEALQKQKIRLIFILDSYDEMRQSSIQSNLIQTNRLTQDLLGEELNKLSAKDVFKVIITTRSEILISQNYQTWFYGESLQSFKEIELKGFDESQKQNYLSQYSIFSAKREIYELYEFVKQATSKPIDLLEFTQIWDKIYNQYFLNNQNADKHQEYLLTEQQIDSILFSLQSENSLKNISEEQKLNLKKKLISLWNSQKYQKLIKLVNIENILTTPFMMEIVVQVLPSMIHKFSEISNVKQSFLENFAQLKEEDIKEKQLILMYEEKKKQLQGQILGDVKNESKTKKIDLQKLAEGRWESLEKINYFASHSIEREVSIHELNAFEDMRIVVRALEMKTLTVFDFYSEFTNYYHQRQIAKLKSQGKIINFEGFCIDLFNFSQSLALDMTLNQVTQTKYDTRGQLQLPHSKSEISEQEQWKEYYFNDFIDGEYKKLIRSCILLSFKGSNYSFNHKSIQEFYVAAYLFGFLVQTQQFFQKNDLQSLQSFVEKELINQDKFNISSEVFKGVLFLLKNKLKQMRKLKEHLIEIIKFTKNSNKFIRAASNSVFILNFNNDHLIMENLSNIKLNQTSLHGMSLYGANLENTQFQAVNISSCNFNDAIIKNANWKDIQCNELPTLNGHNNMVSSVAVSNNGFILASGSTDRTIRIWDFKAGKQLFVLEGHSDGVLSVAFSPNGEILASGSHDNSIRLWDTSTGKVKQILQGHTDSVRSVDFSPDGEMLASGSSDKSIRVWDLKTGKEIQIIEGHTDAIRSVAFSPDGHLLASGGNDKSIKLWNTLDWKEVATLKKHADDVLSVAFSPDSKILASGSYNQIIRLWDVQSAKELALLKGHTSKVQCVAFSKDGQILASCSGDKSIRLWDVKTGKEQSLLERHTDTVLSVAFSPDGQILFSSSEDQTVRIWDVNAGKELSLFEGHGGDVWSVAFSPDGQTLASGSGDKTIKLWDVKSGKQLQSLESHTLRVRSVAFSPDGSMLASGSYDEKNIIWAVKGGKQHSILEGHEYYVRSVSFSPDGTLLASGSNDKTLRLWDISSGKELKVLKGHKGYVRSVAFSADGQVVASGSSDKTIRLWDVKTGKEQKVLEGHSDCVMCVIYSPDGQGLASCSNDKTIRLWNLKAEKETTVLRGHSERVLTIAFSPQGNFLASGSSDKTIRIWDNTGKEIYILQGHTNYVRSVTFSPDGQILVSGSSDSSIRLWNFPASSSIIGKQQKKEIQCFQIISQRRQLETQDCEITGSQMISQHKFDLRTLFTQKGAFDS